MSNPDDPRSWLAKVENDLLNIRNNLQAALVPWDESGVARQPGAWPRRLCSVEIIT